MADRDDGGQDPEYLTQEFVISSQFKKETDAVEMESASVRHSRAGRPGARGRAMSAGWRCEQVRCCWWQPRSALQRRSMRSG